MTVDKVAILGGGAFGIALSKLVAKNSHQVTVWARNNQVVKSINTLRKHPKQLRDIMLDNNVNATSCIKEAVSQASYVILAVPMDATAEVLKQAPIDQNAIIINTAKGIVSDTLELSADIVKKNTCKDLAIRACYLSGPSFARELAQDLPTALTIASFNHESARKFQIHFSSKNCRLYWSDDVVGVCVGGAMKNVIAIAAGTCSGLKLGKNALAALITRGLAEMTRLAIKMGARSDTMSGLAGVGDLLLSCTDEMSRNFRLGLLLSEAKDLSSALKSIGTVVEGAKTAKAIVPLMQKYGIDMPISYAVHQVLYGGVKPERAIEDLLERALKEERN
ncbi:MAG: NAD(P)-dependent glycerol-3-phosphate dehydrogenase [Myxococcales bacterium]|nr:NAD(P)-dependent glycerol-3-phosphate dehydrogenase [Myxococcales bacterium]USN50467.1 MAG: NAD(P)-dependent glycerol-3-phosphate dehydrogenase [Myxococcales bacterium]